MVRRVILFFAILATMIAAVWALTDWQHLRNQRDEHVKTQHSRLIQQLPTAQLPSSAVEPPRKNYKEGQAMARIRVPVISADWAMVEGTSESSLDKGAAHYSFAARPGEIGNFAFACHRIRSLCLDVDQLDNGDDIFVEYEGQTYTYRIYKHYVVLPTQVQVVDPVPNMRGQEPTEKLLTLTTCLRNNEGGNQKRYIIHARLV